MRLRGVRALRLTLLLLPFASLACGDSSAVSAPPADGGGSPEAGLADAASPQGDAAAPTEAGSDGGFDLGHVPGTIGNGTTQGSAACGQAGAATGLRTIALDVGGVSRTGVVFVPASYNPKKAYPVVFVFHGDGGTGASIRGGLNLETAAAGKAIFAYPDGTNKTWDATVGGANQDMDFVLAVRESLRSQYCVDMRRTFATGHSRGGFFVNQLACQYGIAEFAAMAPQSGTIDPGSSAAYVYGPPNPNGGPYMEGGAWDFMCPSDGKPSANPPPPVLPPPMLVIHGQCDVEGGVEFPQGRRSVEHWGYAARCTSTPAVSTTSAPACSAPTTCPTTVADPCYSAPGCAAGHDITFCAIPGMGHNVWCEAPARVWGFFAAH